MKTHELIKQLESLPDLDIKIVIKPKVTTIGGMPGVMIDHIQSGFDWDNGTLLIFPEKNLTIFDDDSARIKELYDKNGWLDYENRGLKAENKKLRVLLSML